MMRNRKLSTIEKGKYHMKIRLEEKYTDPVTGGGNERWIKEKYQENCLLRMNHYAVMTIHIKNFRGYLLRYGKNASEEILKEFYDVTEGLLHENEWLSRIYSDHFVILLQRESKEALVQFIYDADWAGCQYPDPRTHLKIFYSFGVYMIDTPDDDFYTALNKAELARTMCSHVHLRNTSYDFYNSSTLKRYLQDCEIEEKAAEAVEKGRFIPYLQPKVRLSDEKIVGAEVLLRWFDENGKLIPLKDYLPVLDRNGYIRNVDLYIFETMCRKLQECRDAGIPVVPLSFNISKSYYNDDNLFTDYMEVFDQYEVPESWIQFELMESISFDDSARMMRLIPGFKRRGFVCMLDDFGSGYSSFQVISSLQLDGLKIDRQFFTKAFNPQDCAITETIIQIAKTLHMETIAEGVEQKEYIDFLKHAGCDMVQGFYYYKPMPVDDFFHLLASQNEF
ncbi:MULTISPECIES: EAL domain-containing protein [Hungatella]|uniref:EAL domain-containing protein n=1 Tax=Hungatella hathewayi TaxID=154046 RepID=A0AAW9WA20_9FIRM|nr:MULTISPECIES: GGDEF domain-containing phosphodiesterase [Hungatella]MCQ4827672.1 GGDEF domain-containing phosphodiesterase [Hungatella sp. SL.1.14]MUB61777.1 EAL domain-containing protein [Hungatella hathewayi]